MKIKFNIYISIPNDEAINVSDILELSVLP